MYDTLRKYVDVELKRDVLPSDLKETLLKEGWEESLVDKVMADAWVGMYQTNEGAQDPHLSVLNETRSSVDEKSLEEPIKMGVEAAKALEEELPKGVPEPIQQPWVDENGVHGQDHQVFGEAVGPPLDSDEEFKPDPTQQVPPKQESDIKPVEPETFASEPIQMTTEPVKKPKKKWLFLLLLLPILFLIPLYLGRQVYLSPERVLMSASTKMTELNSFSYSAKLNYEYTNPGGSEDTVSLNPTSYTLDTEGAVDLVDGLKLSSMFDLTIGSSWVNSKIGSGELVLFNGELFARLTEMGVMGFLNMGELTGAWVKIEPQDFEGSLITSFESDPARIEAFKQLISGMAFSEVTEEMGEEVINGKPAYHYRYEVTKEGLTEFYRSLADISNVELTEEDLAATVEASPLPNGEIWVDKESYYIVRFTVTMSDPTFKFGIDATLGGFNTPNMVVKPEDYISVEEFMQQFNSQLEGTGSLPLEFKLSEPGEDITEDEVKDLQDFMELEAPEATDSTDIDSSSQIPNNQLPASFYQSSFEGY